MRHPVRRPLAALLVVLGAALMLVGLPATAAQAAPRECGYGNMTATQCTCPTLAVSTTTPGLGGKFVVTGANFEPRRVVSLILKPVRAAEAAQRFTTGDSTAAERFVTVAARSYDLGRVRTSAQGTFTATVTMPRSAVGTFDVYAVGGTVPGATDASGVSCPADPSAQLSTAANRGGNTTENSTENNETTTAFTGLNILWMVLLAAALIVVGLVLARRGAARKSDVRSIHG